MTLTTAMTAHSQEAPIPFGSSISPMSIEATEVDSGCQDHIKAKIESRELNESEGKFRLAICDFHGDSKSPDLETANRIIQSLRNAQTQGLSSSKQALATLLEGLSHCRRAKISMTDYQTNEASMVDFCSGRKNAVVAFGDVRWQHAHIVYSAGSDGKAPYTVSDLMDEMASCYSPEGPLNQSFDTECGINPSISETDQSTMLDEIYPEVSGTFFGGTNPITAMFSRKKEFSDEAVSRLAGDVTVLESRSSTIEKIYKKISLSIQDLESRVTTALDNYKNSYATGSAILARIEEWQRGLLTEKQGDLSIDHTKKLQDAASLLGENNQAFGGGDGEIARVTRFSKTVKKFETIDEDTEKTALKLCKMFYCGLAVANSGSPSLKSHYTRACETNFLFSVQKNPLCANVRTKLNTDEEDITVAVFCERNGFDINKFGRVGLTTSEAQSCWEESN